MIKTIRGFMKRLNEDHVGAYAAQSAYFILLSFIPFVLLVVTLVKYTPLTRDDVYSVQAGICKILGHTRAVLEKTDAEVCQLFVGQRSCKII